MTKRHYSLETPNQARNQLGTPGGAKSFLRGAKIFKLCPTHFSRGAKILVTGLHLSTTRCNRTVALLCRIFCAKHATSTALHSDSTYVKRTHHFRCRCRPHMNENSCMKVKRIRTKAKWFQRRMLS